MRVLGRDLVEAHLGDAPIAEAVVLRAWLHEVAHADWKRPTALALAFTGADISRLPRITFELASAPLQIDVLVDFQTGVLLVTQIRRSGATLAQKPTDIAL